MANCAIVGINWGDEGKGRMVDLLTEDYDVVVRFQGGGNAGHTVINDKGEVIQCTFDFQCDPDGKAHIPHWVTCPYSDSFRKKDQYEL